MPLLPLQIQPAIQANKPSQPAESHPVCAPQALTPDLYLLKVILSEPLFLNCQRSRKLPQSQRMTTTEVNQKLWWQKRPPLRDQVKPRNAYSGLKQVASRTGKNIMVNLDQNSDAKHNQVLSQKTKIKIRMGMIIRAYISFWLEKDQDENSTAYCCQWCPNSFKVSGHSTYNLKTHRDGANNKGSIQSACPGREKAIAAGVHLPPTAGKALKEKSKGQPASTSNLISYTTKGRFDNKTLNKLLVIWIVRQSLLWPRIEDFLLCVCFDYAAHNSKLHSWIWAAMQAHLLYLKQRTQVINVIKTSGLKISLVSNVWTTKGSHKVFLWIMCCYIDMNWTYVCQHLAIKYILWHHNESNLTFHLSLHVLAQTTNSGSNNFTMAKSALNLPKAIVTPKKADKPFPVLYSIPKEEGNDSSNEITKITNQPADQSKDKYDDVDPDNAEAPHQEPGWENEIDEDMLEECDQMGIAFTLKKIDYICRRIALSSQKRGEWGLWAKRLGWKCAYNGRRVIKQLLKNENDKCAGKLRESHFFKSYTLCSEEWDNVNSLNNVLKDFLEMTKRMEGDGPKLPMVLYKYIHLLENLERKEADATSTPLEPMFAPMIHITKKYLDFAVILATFLHPAWRMMLFTKRLEKHVPRVKQLITETFKEHKEIIKLLWPPSSLVLPKTSQLNSKATNSDSGDEFNFYSKVSQAAFLNTELKQYNSGMFPMEKKGDVLAWWKVSILPSSLASSLQVADILLTSEKLPALPCYGFVGEGLSCLSRKLGFREAYIFRSS
ncbi:hypothetical protein PTTG_25117 [Puccinia triticina 1-1 BBBD Race 1]|uniref:HAT C-terminal dimerisation domain-containing protein n=1 Tax=Puccinia triticina (isolate 1-1 / race 1 (BBBD)) TaxID=630390 RepID=A0A180H5Y6_PUCT1|nr:hypothetical protein PTTG_25117 [Puccinia triticina 1-1 BBBD Race 1]